MGDLGNVLRHPLFAIGDRQTTVGMLLVLVACGTVLLGKLARNKVLAMLGEGHKGSDESLRFYAVGAQALVWLVGCDLALHLLGIHLPSMFAASGFLAVGAGFGVKNFVENFVSGGILRREKTIRPNDLVIVDGRWLIVQRVGPRTTEATTYEGEQVLIPNSTIAQSSVENLTRNNLLYRIEMQVGVAYNSDLDLVRKTLEEAIDGLAWRSAANVPRVYLRAFGASSVDYDVDVWIDDANDARGRRSDLHEAVWRALRGRGITIAYPQLDVHLDTQTGHGKYAHDD